MDSVGGGGDGDHQLRQRGVGVVGEGRDEGDDEAVDEQSRLLMHHHDDDSMA